MPSLSRLYNLRSGKSAPQLLALLLTLVVTAPTLFAQEWDHLNGRDKAHDPTGAWLLNTPAGFFLVVLFYPQKDE